MGIKWNRLCEKRIDYEKLIDYVKNSIVNL